MMFANRNLTLLALAGLLLASAAPGRFGIRLGLLLFAFVSMAAAASSAAAATFIVTNAADVGPGSLRQAIIDANSNPDVDTILFHPSVTGTITLVNGQLAITDAVTITGPGAQSLTISGNSSSRVFDIATTGAVSLSGLRIVNGFSGGQAGGGIRSTAPLTLTNCEISGCHNNNIGGGLRQLSTNATINGCTFSGNSANIGGGVYLAGSAPLFMATITNCTFVNNTASTIGGAIRQFSTVPSTTQIINCTIVENNASDGGGVALAGTNTAMYLRNTVVAGNTATTAGPNIFATTGAISAGHNLIGDGTGSNFTPVIGDLVGTTSAPIDPLLAPLAQNGGPTPTMLPLLNSPVVDRGTNVAAPAVDQRGLQRSVGCATDIGAVEVQTDSNCTDCCDPANDNCGDAVTLLPAGTGVLGVPGDLTLATLDGPSTVCGVGVGRDVWYRFQPNASADWDIRTCSDGGVDTVIELFDGCSGTSVACNDDADGCGDGTQSRLVVPLDGSVSYLLRICSKLAAPAGPFNLEVTRAVPSNDDCTGATFLSSFPFTDSPYHLLATHDPIIMGCNPGPGLTRHGVWYAYTPSTDCTLIVSETSANDVAMALFTGADCGSLVEVACTLAETDAFALTANTSYWQLIGMHSATAVPTTPLVIEFECVPPFPNDDCATATVIAETPFSHTVDFRLAAPDPDVTCNQSSNVHTRHGVWWTYTPSIDCIAVLSETSTNDTITAVFTGGCDNLFEVHCSDAEGSIFTMQAGVQYHVLVGAWSATTILTTPITFNLDCVLPPENDACINAIPLVCDTSVAGSTTLATAEGVPVPATCPDTFEGGSNLVQNHRKGVWYRVIGDGNAWTLSTCNAGTNFDTQIAVFTGGCDNPICFVANDDMNQTGWSCPISSRRAAVRFGTVPGEEYLVLVMPSSSGPAVPSNFQLDVICTGCCQDGDCIFVSADACAAGGGAPPVDATSCGPPEGHALDFAGNNGYVNVGTLGTFGSTLNTFTAELWVRTTDTSQIHVPLKLIDTPGTPTDPVFAIEMNRTNLGGGAPVYAAGQTLFYLRDGNNMVFSRSISANIYDGQWHHIAWRVLDAVNNNMEVYVDGGLHPQIEGLSQSPVNFPDWTRFLTIGAANNRGTIEAWFNGQIDDVRLWAVARTQVQIFANMNLSVAPNTPGLYAAWRLDDGAGTTALDLNGVYHGTLVGGPSWIDSSPCAVPCGPADINCDGVLDMADVDVFVGVLLSTNTDPDHVARSDFNGDGVADGMDIQLFAEHILDG